MQFWNWFKRAAPERTENRTESVDKFITEMETGVTDEWCKCKWRIHPDDQGGKIGECVVCGTKRNSGKHFTLEAFRNDPDVHRYRGVRKVRVDNHPYCPVHTKEGLILRYLEWAEADVTR